MAGEEKEPNIFQAWADGYERGQRRFMASQGRGPAPQAGGLTVDSPKKKTDPKMSAKPASKQFAQRVAPVEARPLVARESSSAAGQTDIVNPWQGAYAQPRSAAGQRVSPTNEPATDAAFWADYRAGERNQADSGAGRFDPYNRAAAGVSNWLRARGYNTEQMGSYIAAGNKPGGSDIAPMTPEERLTLEPDMDFDRWYELNTGNPQAQWGY